VQEALQKSTQGIFGTVANPIEMMWEEHAAEGERFRKIAACNDYTPPKRCPAPAYIVTFAY